MTSPFVDRVEFQVIGRDVNASRTFRDVADAANDAGDEIRQLETLLRRLSDLSGSRDITITTNVREVLGQIEDNRAVLDLIKDRFETLNVTVHATVNQLVELNDGITTIDDNRTAIVTLDDDFRNLTQRVIATVDSVVELNDGITTIDDNRNVIITLDDDFRTLTQRINATVDSIVELNDGITTIDDNRNVIIRVDDDFRRLTQRITATVDSVVNLNNGIATIDDNRNVIIRVDDDFRTLTQRINATVDSITNLNDGLNNVDDRRNNVIDLGHGFDDLSTSIERSRRNVTDLDRDLRNLPPGRDITNNNREVDTRRTIETVSSNRDRWERLGLAAGAVAAAGFLTSFNAAVSDGLESIPVVGKAMSSFFAAISASAPEIAAPLAVVLGVVAASAAVIVANAFSAGILAALGGGVLLAGFIAAFADPTYKSVIKSTGKEIADTFKGAVMDSGFTGAMIDSLNTIKQAFADLKPAITELFRAASPLLKPLVDGMVGFGRNVLPGVTEAVRNMKPIFDELGRWLPKLGWTIGKFFADLSQQSPQLARALGYVLGAVDSAIKFIGGLLVVMAKLEPFAESIFRLIAALWRLSGPLVPVQTLVGGLISMLNGAASVIKAFADGIDWLAGKLSKATGMLSLGTGALGIFGGQAGIATSKAFDLAKSIFGIPDANPTATLHDFASSTTRAVKAGLVALDRYKAVPTVVVDDQTESTLEGIQNALRRLNGKKVQVFVEGVQTGTTIYHGLSSGGAVFGPGPKGKDSRLAMLAPGEHVLTAREVDAAGGQAAVYALRRSLLRHDSLGGTGAPDTSIGMGRRSSGVDANDMAVALRRALSGMTLVIDDRSGRTAQLIARGG